MSPTYRDGDLLLVRRSRRLRRGRAVVFRSPDRSDPPLLVKRLVALPGDHHPALGWQVPPATFAVLGDNLARSRDSRHFGPLAVVLAIGHVLHHFPAAGRAGRPAERPAARSAGGPARCEAALLSGADAGLDREAR